MAANAAFFGTQGYTYSSRWLVRIHASVHPRTFRWKKRNVIKWSLVRTWEHSVDPRALFIDHLIVQDNTPRIEFQLPPSKMSDPRLKDLTLVSVELTQRTLGSGSYGEVVEVRLDRLRCAGKKLHDVFFSGSFCAQQQAIIGRFVEECLR